ncbi:hypothetical protein HT136_11195 [Novosphingobium profundi]|uniref:hypothetical protein n=1 Tax=Novosphingobium profundi TaxID=1774954 RepID=UPI001BDB3AA3|nr:hypothetical protein [Novosphingobium profundi]MBT0668933.1 hypothetical protein [Novosphingobium profundi]
MPTAKTRHQFYLPDGLSESLAKAAAEPGNSKTLILTKALAAWFEQDTQTPVMGVCDRQDCQAMQFEAKLDRIINILLDAQLSAASEGHSHGEVRAHVGSKTPHQSVRKTVHRDEASARQMTSPSGLADQQEFDL